MVPICERKSNGPDIDGRESMKYRDPLWQEVWRTLRNHRRPGAWRGRNVLRRLLTKRFGELPSDDEGWTISKEKWSIGMLLQHGCGRHDRSAPKKTCGPVVMARRSGKLWVIDGANRINHWSKVGDAGPHEVLVINLDHT